MSTFAPSPRSLLISSEKSFLIFILSANSLTSPADLSTKSKSSSRYLFSKSLSTRLSSYKPNPLILSPNHKNSRSSAVNSPPALTRLSISVSRRICSTFLKYSLPPGSVLSFSATTSNKLSSTFCLGAIPRTSVT